MAVSKPKNTHKMKKQRVVINPLLAKNGELLAATRGQTLHELVGSILERELRVNRFDPFANGEPGGEKTGGTSDQ